MSERSRRRAIESVALRAGGIADELVGAREVLFLDLIVVFLVTYPLLAMASNSRLFSSPSWSGLGPVTRTVAPPPRPRPTAHGGRRAPQRAMSEVLRCAGLGRQPCSHHRPTCAK